MVRWWEIDLPDANAPVLMRAVAYYRHSAQDRQENSISIQQDQVRTWARENGVEIIREFCDAGRSGLNAEELVHRQLIRNEALEGWFSELKTSHRTKAGVTGATGTVCNANQWWCLGVN